MSHYSVGEAKKKYGIDRDLAVFRMHLLKKAKKFNKKKVTLQSII